MDPVDPVEGMKDDAAQLLLQIDTLLTRIGDSPEELLAGLGVAARAANVIESYRLGFTARLQRLPGAAGPGGEVLVSGHELAVGEISAAQSVTMVAAAGQVELATDITACLPRVFAAMRTGALDVARARVFVEELVHLGSDHAVPIVTAPVRAEVEDLMVPVAPGLTTAQLRARLRRETARRIAAARRVTRPRGRRQGVHTSDLPGLEGLGELHAVLPADAIALAEQTIDAMASALCRPEATVRPEGLPDGLSASRPVRQIGDSDSAHRYRVHQWARSEALAAVLREVAEGRPLSG